MSEKHYEQGDVKIETFKSNGQGVLQIEAVELADGSYWSTIQFTSGCEARAFANAIIRASETLQD